MMGQREEMGGGCFINVVFSVCNEPIMSLWKKEEKIKPWNGEEVFYWTRQYNNRSLSFDMSFPACL